MNRTQGILERGKQVLIGNYARLPVVKYEPILDVGKRSWNCASAAPIPFSFVTSPLTVKSATCGGHGICSRNARRGWRILGLGTKAFSALV